MSWQN